MNSITVNDRKEGPVGELRRSGMVPGVVYGYDMKPRMLSVKQLDLLRAYEVAGESVLVSVVFPDKTDYKVVINEIARDPLSGDPIHVDFYRVNLNKPIEAEVELLFNGVSLAVKNDGGTLVKGMTKVKVRALPLEMPKSIDVDISSLNTFDEVIRVSNLPVPPGVTILAGADEAVASVTPPRSEEELKSLDTKIEEDVDKVEVEEKGKKEEEVPAEEGKEAATPAAKPAAKPEKK